MRRIISVFLLVAWILTSAAPGGAATTILKRAEKGAPLSWAEMDANFENLRTGLDSNIAAINAAIANLQASQSSGSIGFQNVAAMVLTYPENTLATVTNDPDPSNNVTWIKIGPSGSGSWQKSALSPALPFFDSRNYTNLSDACTAIGSVNQATLYVTTTLQVPADYTSTSNISIVVLNGGAINVASGRALVVNGLFNAAHHCFLGSGLVQFGSGAKNTILPEWWGAKADGTTDSTAAIRSALLAADAAATVRLGVGTYLVSGEITVTKHRVHLAGAGSWATRILFQPTASSTCLSINAGSSVLYQGSIRGICFFSSDATYTKIAIDIVDTSGYKLDDIIIGGSVAAGGSTFWSGASSIGLRVRGRELCSLKDLYIYADKPILIAKNPNISIDIDHFHFADCILAANGNPIVEIATGVNLTQLTFDGYQAWCVGTYGLYWNDTSATLVSNGLRLDNIRFEQGTSTAAWLVYINHSYGLQNLQINYAAGGVERNGYFLRKVQNVTFQSVYYTGSTGRVALDANQTVTDMFISNCFWQTGSTANMTGQSMIWGAPNDQSNAPLPWTALYNSTTNSGKGFQVGDAIAQPTITVANGDAASLGSLVNGIVAVVSSEALPALVMCCGGQHAVFILNDPMSLYSATAGTAGKTNVYWSTANARYELQNMRGMTLRYKIVTLGSYSYF